MADSLTLLRKNMHNLKHCLPDDLVKIKRACEEKRLQVKGKRSLDTLDAAIIEINKALAV